ncbi:MAG: histidine kinase N-terminal 7TM domain-containing protein [Halapricum sp.]
MIASLYLPLVLLSAVGGIGLALFAWLHRETPGAAPLSLFLLAASVWSLADALSVASSSGVVWWAFLKYAISTLLPLSWLLVVFEYTGRERWLAGPRLPVLVVEPIVFSALSGSNMVAPPADVEHDQHLSVLAAAGVGDHAVRAVVDGVVAFGAGRRLPARTGCRCARRAA